MEPIPEGLLEAIRRYEKYRYHPGSFLEAVLSGDLFAAVSRADERSLQALPHLVRWIYCQVPSACWGSADKFRAWMEEG